MSSRARLFAGKRGLIAIGLSVAMLTAAIAVVAVLALGARPAYGSGSGGGGCFATGPSPACTFQNNSASVDFSNVSSDGCIYTDAGVSVYDNLTTPGQNTTQTAFIYLSEWNYCTGVPLVEAGDFDPTTGLSTFTGTIQLASDLTTAKVTGAAPMYDWVSGTQLFTTSIDLTFNGYGPTSRFSDSQHFQAPGYVMNSHYSGTSRTAEASGAFTDQNDINLAAQPTTYGYLLNTSGGTVQLSRQ